jgi:hypothetical protein
MYEFRNDAIRDKVIDDVRDVLLSDMVDEETGGFVPNQFIPKLFAEQFSPLNIFEAAYLPNLLKLIRATVEYFDTCSEADRVRYQRSNTVYELFSAKTAKNPAELFLAYNQDLAETRAKSLKGKNPKYTQMVRVTSIAIMHSYNHDQHARILAQLTFELKKVAPCFGMSDKDYSLSEALTARRLLSLILQAPAISYLSEPDKSYGTHTIWACETDPYRRMIKRLNQLT